MVKSNNKGFSLVEVIIAVAVFAILVGPITSSLISALNIGTTSTKKQYAVETAEEILEGFKTVDISGGKTVSLPADDGSTTYDFAVTNTATRTVSLVTESGTTYNNLQKTDGTALTVTATTYTYTCNDVALGTNYEKYASSVDVDDCAYQVLKAGYVMTGYTDDTKTKAIVKTESGSAVTTGTTSTGVIRNLDGNNAAIIVTATYNDIAQSNNLDNLAYQNFLDKKKSLIRSSKYTVFATQLDKGINIFQDDMFAKTTTIKISKEGSGTNLKYVVTCSVKYVDNTGLGAIRTDYEKNGDNVYEPELWYSDQGVVYQQSFEGELPPIYLVYVPAIYNGRYVNSDTIVIDNSEIKGDDVKTDVYVLETAADVASASSTYKDIVTQTLSTTKTKTGRANDNIITNVNQLIYENSNYVTTMKSVAVNIKKTDLSDASSDKVSVYGNFSATSDYSYTTLEDDDSGEVYRYDLTVDVTADSGSGTKTTVTGTRGK